MRWIITSALCSILLTNAAAAQRIFDAEGRPTDEGFFPLAVWLQNPTLAPRYQAAGINLYIGLWKGLTAEQLSVLEAAGMPVICDQNEYGLTQLDNPLIAAWMHADEPDNAQKKPEGGYGPPVTPETIVAGYRQMRERDPSRPVVLNLSMGVAWDGWVGRGVRTNHPEDYPQYLEGCDIASFDVYPAASDRPEVAGKLELVPYGVSRLQQWTDDATPTWTCIETGPIHSPDRRPSPEQVRSEIWMALIQGADGLIYFVHQFKPQFNDHALLDDAAMLEEVTRINEQIQELAPVLYAPEAEGLTVDSDGDVRAVMKRRGGRTYVFAANFSDEPAEATMRFAEAPTGVATVLDEDRTVELTSGAMSESFEPYAVHLYVFGE